jgi:hypothetical protein
MSVVKHQKRVIQRPCLSSHSRVDNIVCDIVAGAYDFVILDQKLL